jgi:hypothetical protein
VGFYSARVRVLAWERTLGCERNAPNGRAAASWKLPTCQLAFGPQLPLFPSRIQFQRTTSILFPSLHSCLSKLSLASECLSIFREFLLRFSIRVLWLSFDRLSFLQQAHGITRGRAPSPLTLPAILNLGAGLSESMAWVPNLRSTAPIHPHFNSSLV